MRRYLALLVTLFLFADLATSHAQATVDGFGVLKQQDFLQTSSSTPASAAILGYPGGPYHFSADLSGNFLNLLNPTPKLTTPASIPYPLTGTATDVEMVRNYTTKSALDAAFPNSAASYIISGGIFSLPISLGASDAYPVDIPKITNGTWDGQGRLFVNPSTGATLNFSNFSAYSVGVGGIVGFDLYQLSGTTVGDGLASVLSVTLSGYQYESPLTSYTIAGGVLQPNQTYYAELSFSRVANLNTNFAASLGAVGVAAFVNTTGFIISTSSAPVFTQQPASQNVTTGSTVTFNAAASGYPAPSYQWRKDGVNINGATSASLTLNWLQLSDAGSYSVVASNSAGSATSNAATLSITEGLVPPIITGLSPARTVLIPGQGLNLGVSVIVTGVPSYQWFRNGLPINGATSGTYSVPSAVVRDSGWYLVTITNAYGTTRSAPMFVTVAPTVTRVRTWGMDFSAVNITPPVDLTDAVSLSAGSGYFLAVRRGGTIIGWGANNSRHNEGRLDLPSGLSGVVAVAAGANHGLALKSDGTVVVWGTAVLDWNRVPDNLADVVAIDAGYNYSLALRSDGTVVAWGDNYYGQSTVPANLNHVVAVVAGDGNSVALKDDGSLVSWGRDLYGELTIAPSATPAAGVAVRNFHSVVLKRDGTVRGFGWNHLGQSEVPAGLSGVVAVAAGLVHSLALKQDGAVVGWGSNAYGQISIPADLSGVIAISAGDTSSAALCDTAPHAPLIITQPQSQTALAGAPVTLSSAAMGSPAPSYQWRKNGVDISGATWSWYTITSAVSGDAGNYTVVVTNSEGSLTSNAAVLTVVTAPSDAVITITIQ